MNYLQFNKGIKNIKVKNIRYYYFEYENNNDDINKTFSFLIGCISLSSPSMKSINWEWEYDPIHCLDENGDYHIKNYGYYTFINCDIKTFINYEISGEPQGSHVSSYISSLIKGELSFRPLVSNGTYINVRLSRFRLFKGFWDLNKDWLKDI